MHLGATKYRRVIDRSSIVSKSANVQIGENTHTVIRGDIRYGNMMLTDRDTQSM